MGVKIILILVLITAQGPREREIEQPSLAECWKQAERIAQEPDPEKMSEAEIIGYGAGCLVIIAPAQDAGR